MTSQTIHMGLSVRGVISKTDAVLKRDYCKWITRDDGSKFTPQQLRATFMDLLSEGKEVVPMGECNNWDYKKGCQGHNMGEEP